MWRNLTKNYKVWQNVLMKCRNIRKIWRNMARHQQTSVRFGGKMRNFDGIWQKTAEFGEKGRNLAKYFKNKKITKCCKIWEKWWSIAKSVDEMAKCGGMLTKFGKIWRATGEIQRYLAEKGEIFDGIWRKVAKSVKKWWYFREIWKKRGNLAACWWNLAKCDEVGSGGGPFYIFSDDTRKIGQ